MPGKYWGSPCSKGHVGPDGLTERYHPNGHCISCQRVHDSQARAVARHDREANRAACLLCNTRGRWLRKGVCAQCRPCNLCGRRRIRKHDHWTCPVCSVEKQRVRSREYESKLRSTEEGLRKHRQRNLYCRRKAYGITPEVFESMFVQQGRCCAICRGTNPGPKDWALDHDHKTGRARGILCVRCNTGIGLLRDDVATLLNAIDYLCKSRDSEEAA